MAYTPRPNMFIAFIASSHDALWIAEKVKANFQAKVDVDIWTDHVFKENRSYLQTLLNLASYYDFAWHSSRPTTARWSASS